MTHAGRDPRDAKFDAFADEYSRMHAENIAASGESPEYFNAYKAIWLERLVGAGFAGGVLDYGCGIGNVTRELAARFARVEGFDPSAESLARARAQVPGARFWERIDDAPDGTYGVVVLSGVLHHVHPTERAFVLAQAAAKLAPGGRLVIFEHNPANPLTRRAVATCPFDDDAILLWPWQASGLCKGAGLDALHTEFIVFFPARLAALRPLERHLSWLPAGAQYVVTARRR